MSTIIFFRKTLLTHITNFSTRMEHWNYIDNDTCDQQYVCDQQYFCMIYEDDCLLNLYHFLLFVLNDCYLKFQLLMGAELVFQINFDSTKKKRNFKKIDDVYNES